MSEKELYSRSEFEQLRIEQAKKMSADQGLKKDAINVLNQADGYHWIHQATWFGEPLLNLPQDMFAIQEIIFKTRPEFIIEVGVAWGGSLLFYATILQALGQGNIIGIDIYIPDDLKQRIYSHQTLSQNISLITGSSIEKSTINKVKELLGGSKKVLIILDSFHGHKHVLEELHQYSQFVGKGYYLICGDTIVEDMQETSHRERPWGHGDNPKTALWEFLKQNSCFENDKTLENKLLFSCNPEGYLQRIKE